MAVKRQMTAAQEILLAAAGLAERGLYEFSEWDLTVEAWKHDHNRFGCRGYEDRYPDHKRVMMEIMGQTKKDNPVRQGWIRRSRTNYYEVTSLGTAEASRLRQIAVGGEPSQKSGQVVYDAVARYVFHPAFRKHLDDANEPRTWLGAQSFLDLSRLDSVAVDDAFRAAGNAATSALRWMEETDQDVLRTGSTGGKRSVLRQEVVQLVRFLDVVKERFAPQLNAIRRQSEARKAARR